MFTQVLAQPQACRLLATQGEVWTNLGGGREKREEGKEGGREAEAPK